VDGRYRKSTSRIHGRKEGRRKRRKNMMISDRLWQCLSYMPKEPKHRLDLFALTMKNNEREKNLKEGRKVLKSEVELSLSAMQGLLQTWTSLLQETPRRYRGV